MIGVDLLQTRLQQRVVQLKKMEVADVNNKTVS
jgi:hypothetical protein